MDQVHSSAVLLEREVSFRFTEDGLRLEWPKCGELRAVAVNRQRLAVG